MSQSRTLFIGRDVPKESMAVAYVAPDHGAEVTDLGSIGTRQCDLDQLLRQRPSKAKQLSFVYEAGPCGAWLSRSLTQKGDDCWGVAPSLLAQQAGDRGTTDRRDAVPLARLARAGDLTAAAVPTVEADAMRDLTRAREDTLSDLQDAKFRLNALLLRHDSRYTGRATWNPAPLRGLAEVVCPTPAQQLVFHAEVRAVTEPTARLRRLAQALQERVQAWRLHPVVDALQALRGVQCTVAVTTVAELGDLTRVEPPSERRQFWGLSPSDYSAGERRRQGAMPKAGNPQARRAVVEGAWAYRDPAKVSRPLHLRLATPPQASQDLSWRAHVRLCPRYRERSARGKHANQVVVAMARALSGFMGAIAQAIPVTPEDQKTAHAQPAPQQVS
jgi:transposase